jgi:heptosyltransferase II
LTDSRVEKILVRGVNWLGDAVMSTPALIRLREAHPAAHIGIVTPAKLAELWQAHPAVDEVIPFTRAEGTGNLSKRIRAGGYQTAIILPNSFRSAFECWMAGIPARVGFGGNGRSVLLTQVVPRRREEIHLRKRTALEVRTLVAESPEKPRDRFPHSGHQLYDYLHLVSALGASSSPTHPRITVTADETARFRAKHDLPDDLRFIGLNPGAEYGPAKRWPAEAFVECAARVHASAGSTGFAWLITGGSGDTDLASEIAAGIQRAAPTARIYNLAGRTSLRELCAALALCDVVVTNDTGPMHLAAAAGTPVIVPFGSTAPELTGPGLPGDDRHRLILGQAPCAPCFLRECPIDLRCLRSITPETVAHEITAITPRTLPSLKTG